MIKKIVLILILLSIVLVACQKAEKQTITPKTETPPIVSGTPVDLDTSGIDSIDTELNSEELNNIESDLDEVNW